MQQLKIIKGGLTQLDKSIDTLISELPKIRRVAKNFGHQGIITYSHSEITQEDLISMDYFHLIDSLEETKESLKENPAHFLDIQIKNGLDHIYSYHLNSENKTMRTSEFYNNRYKYLVDAMLQGEKLRR